MLKAFSSFSDVFVSPLFPRKGEDVAISIVFSSRPDSVTLRTDSDEGTMTAYAMEERGTFNGAFRYSAVAKVTSLSPFCVFFFRYFYTGRVAIPKIERMEISSARIA